MNTYSLTNRPAGMATMAKMATIDAALIAEPFVVETQEGPMTISPETVDDWDGGYYIAYPSDGSKPYSIAPSFIKDNYKVVG